MKQLMKSALFACGLALALIAVMPKPMQATAMRDSCASHWDDYANFYGYAEIYCDPINNNYNPTTCREMQDTYGSDVVYLFQHDCLEYQWVY